MYLMDTDEVVKWTFEASIPLPPTVKISQKTDLNQKFNQLLPKKTYIKELVKEVIFMFIKTHISFPIEQFQTKVKSLNLDKIHSFGQSTGKINLNSFNFG